MADPKGEMTVVEQVYYQVSGGQPRLVESRFSRKLESDEQPYERHLKVGVEGAPLDCGWIEKASQLVITNEEGRNLQVNPTDEEREELQRKVLELGYEDCPVPLCLIHPGESIRFCPFSLEGLGVHSRFGVIRFTLHLFPT